MKKVEGPLVKIKLIHPVGFLKETDEGKKAFHLHLAGEVISVSEDVAKEYCDRSFKSTLDKQIQFVGDIETMRPTIVRAVRI